MPILKAADTFLSSQSLPAATSVTGPTIDLRERYGTYIIGKVTNGATGPTTPPEFTVEVSNDNFAANTSQWSKHLAKTGNNDVTEMPITLPPEILFARVKFKAGTGQASTVEATGGSVTTLG